MLRYEPQAYPPLGKTFLPTLENRLTILQEMRKEALATHETARRIMKERNFRMFSPWKVRNKVWLETTNLRLQYLCRKLSPKRLGPFEITQVLSPLVYRLKLLSTWKIHDVFHAGLLSPFKQTDVHSPSFSVPPPTMIGSEEEYEVEAIVSHKGSPGRRKYLTAWKGYPASENTWEPESNLRHAPQILGNYKRTHLLRALKTIPCLTPADKKPRSPQRKSNLLPSTGPTFRGNLASPSTNSTFYDETTLTWVTPNSTPTSAKQLAAPSITSSPGRGVSS